MFFIMIVRNNSSEIIEQAPSSLATLNWITLQGHNDVKVVLNKKCNIYILEEKTFLHSFESK